VVAAGQAPKKARRQWSGGEEGVEAHAVCF
jgi:hypothetical protein